MAAAAPEVYDVDAVAPGVPAAAAVDEEQDEEVLSVAVTPAKEAAIGWLAEPVGGGGGRQCAIEAWLVYRREERAAANCQLDGRS